MEWVVVGLGGAGRGHTAQIAATEGLHLAGVYDADAGLAEAAATKLGVRAYSSFEALLNDTTIAGVSLATPSALHAQQAVACLEAGKHVISEKPFALDSEEAGRIAAAARQADRLALPFHNRRWDPDFRLVLDIARAGTLGEVRVVRSAVAGPGPDGGWRLNRAMGGGRLNDWGPHLFSQIYEWFGGDALEVEGYTTTVYPQNECDDLFIADMRFAPNVRVSVSMSGFSHVVPPRWEVLGTEGTLLLTGNIHGEFTVAWKRADGQEETKTYQRRDVAPPVPIYAGIVAYLNGQGTLPVSLEEGVAVARWLETVRTTGARREGKTI